MTTNSRAVDTEPLARAVPELEQKSNLSRSQLLIWMGQKLNPEAPLYNMVLTFAVAGPVDGARFRRAFQMLVDSSDALRTQIVEKNGIPHRRVVEAFTAHVDEIDFSGKQDPEHALEDWVATRARRVFDLKRCLFDTALVRLSDEHFVWYFNQHHLITDGWSVALAYRRLVDFYRLARGEEPFTPQFPTFDGYVHFERESLVSAASSKARHYWSTKLAKPFAPTEFYGHAPRERAPRTKRVVCELGPERSHKLKSLAAQPGVKALTADLSRFNVFVTALFAYLHRISGRDELAILTPAHNRPTPAFKNTIGLFIEIFPLHVSVEPEETFATLLDKVRRETQTFLLNARPGTSGPTHSRPYDVLLNYIHSSFGEFDGMPMSSQWVHPGHGDPNHSLRLQVHDFDASGNFVLHFDLNRGVFGDFEERAAVRHFIAILDALLDDDRQPVAAVDLMTESEAADHLDRFNRTETTRHAGSVVSEFEAQAAARGADTALVCEGNTVSYGALNRRANRLARRLHRLDLAPESRVALFLRRSPELVVAILGTLKAGCAYVPIEPRTPAGRVAAMVEDSAAAVVVTEASLAAELPEVSSTVLVIDDGGSAPDEPSADVPSMRPGSEQLAYVIYTSGSTGTPKGVMVEHGALANYARWACERYLGGERLDFALFTSIAFDLTVTSIFVPLISGGRIVIYADDDDVHDLAVLRVVDEDAVDVIKLTPAHLALLQHHPAQPSRLAKLIVGGENLRCELARAISDRLGARVDIFNEYGPTEATVGCMVHRFDPETDRAGSVPIGVPAANTRIYLLDRHRRPVATGITGEIAISGRGLARGYWGRAAITAERFVDNPLRPGEPLYLTGDLARRLPSGELVFLGREDHQVKIRGARIELAEIETALSRHEGVARCVAGALEVQLREDAAAAVATKFCARCGLADAHPEARLDAEAICSICRSYDGYRDRAERYFRSRDDLRRLFEEARSTRESPYDCLMLLSGGKDSTYALYQLVEMGLDVLVFSLDNGYISEGAKANIRRVVDDLGLELVFGHTPAMNRIFADSLARFSNVCNGCFKTIYTMGMNLARERNIRFIVTGLSRGQIFETRLADLFENGVFDPEAIDRTIVEARKAYHRMDDAVSRCLDVDVFDDAAVFDTIRFIDFYRYCDVDLDEILAFLRDRAPWIRPEDTGRSTNCLINETGIYVHKKERGFHNYALPYSWDVRLGHKSREAALAELDDDIDEARVLRTLREVGYETARTSTEKRLAAYYVPASAKPPEASELRSFLSERLPAFMVPSYFVPLESIPLTPNGKIDRGALPTPDRRPGEPEGYVAPRNETERRLVQIWEDVLAVTPVGVHDDFLELGGDSILNIQIVARAGREGLRLTPKQVFDHPTVAELASVVATHTSAAFADVVDAPVVLTPIQHWFFEQDFAHPEHWNQIVHLEAAAPIEPARLERALGELHRRHDALRLRFRQEDARAAKRSWVPALAPEESVAGRPALTRFDFSALSDDERERAMAAAETDANARLDLATGPVVRALLFQLGPDRPARVVIVAHHLVVDAVSWWSLIEDLETAYDAGDDGATRTADRAASWHAWTMRASQLARSDRLRDELGYWREAGARLASPAPAGRHADDVYGSARRVSRRLDRALTGELVTEIPRASGASVEDVLVTALAMSFRRAMGRASIRLDLESHGRDGDDITSGGFDLSRTVGWLTALYPVTLRLPEGDAPGDALRAVQAQLDAVPRRGIGYGLLRYLGDDATRPILEALPAAEIAFNYLGRSTPVPAGSKLFLPPGRLSVSRSPVAERTHALEIDAVLAADELEFHWSYGPARYASARIEALAEECIEAVRAIVHHCRSTSETALTPADFPEADLTRAELDDLLEEFGEPNG